MKVGIHYEPLYNISKRLERYEQILKFNNIEVIYISSSNPDFFKIIKEFDAIIWYVGLADVSKQPYYNIVPVIENDLKIPCFPSSKSAWSFDSKIRQIHQMIANGCPMVESWVAYEKKEALRIANEIELPVVFKLSGGAGSSNVILVKNRKELIKYTKKLFNKGITLNHYNSTFENKGLMLGVTRNLSILKKKIFKNKNISYRFLIKNWILQKNYLFLQKFLPNNNFDTRITTIGNRAFAFRRFNRPNDFRSSGSGKIDYNVKDIDIRFVKKAFEISNYFGFETMAYDFLYDVKNEPVICEYSYGYNDEAVKRCTGYWDENFNFVEGNFWPQYFHMMDLLNLPNLIQPENL